jgi:hypothetical protein
MVEGKTSNRPEIHRTSWLSRQIQLNNTFAPQEAAQTWENAGAKELQPYDIRKCVYTFLRILRCKTGRPKPLTGTNQKSGAFYQNYEHQTCSSNKR